MENTKLPARPGGCLTYKMLTLYRTLDKVVHCCITNRTYKRATQEKLHSNSSAWPKIKKPAIKRAFKISNGCQPFKGRQFGTKFIVPANSLQDLFLSIKVRGFRAVLLREQGSLHFLCRRLRGDRNLRRGTSWGV